MELFSFLIVPYTLNGKFLIPSLLFSSQPHVSLRTIQGPGREVELPLISFSTYYQIFNFPKFLFFLGLKNIEFGAIHTHTHTHTPHIYVVCCQHFLFLISHLPSFDSSSSYLY